MGISAIGDGTSNQILIGEESSWGTNPTTGNNQVEIRTGWNYTAWMGSNWVEGSPSYAGRGMNTTTIVYPVNTKDSTLFGMSTTPVNTTNSRGIHAAHAGGAYTLLGDGHVKFLSESLDLTTLKNLCSRNDGKTLGEF